MTDTSRNSSSFGSGEFPAVDTLIDHRGTMALIDKLVEATGVYAVCRAKIRSDNLFLVDNCLPSWTLIEYIAQSVAVFAGYSRISMGSSHKHGLLLGCRNLQLENVELRVGDQLEIQVEEITRFDDLGSFHGCVLCHGKQIALGTLMVYEQDEWPSRKTSEVQNLE